METGRKNVVVLEGDGTAASEYRARREAVEWQGARPTPVRVETPVIPKCGRCGGLVERETITGDYTLVWTKCVNCGFRG